MRLFLGYLPELKKLIHIYIQMFLSLINILSIPFFLGINFENITPEKHSFS